MSELVDMKRRALVTGATGYIGSNLVRRLIIEGWGVHVIVRPNSDLSVLESIRSKITVHQHDGSIQSMIELVRQAKPSTVFHLASLFLAQHQPKDVEKLIISNLLFSTQVAEAMVVSDVKYLINAGTSWQHYKNSDYNPVNLYAATKQAFEDILTYYIEAHGLRITTLALFDTYGPNDPRQKLLTLLSKVANSHETLGMSPGEQFIDLVYIDDVIDAFYLSANAILQQKEGHMRYGISSGRPLRLKELVSIYEQTLGVNLPVEWGHLQYRPREVMEPWTRWSAIPGWKPQVLLDEGLRRLSAMIYV